LPFNGRAANVSHHETQKVEIENNRGGILVSN